MKDFSMTESVTEEIPEVLHHYAFEEVLAILKSDEYPYLAGDAGAGKNIIAEQCADALSEELGIDLPFGFSGKVSSEYKLKGFKGPDGYSETLFISLFKNGGLFFLDEIDASEPDALTSINAGIANGYIDVDHHEPEQRIIKKHPNFYLIAGGNTKGFGATLKFTSRQPQDGATLSRFTIVDVDYDLELERKLAERLNGQQGLKMMSMVHQVRNAVQELHLDEIQNVGTRELVKTIKFNKNGFSDERALFKATMDKLEADAVEQVTARINQDLDDFDIKAGLGSRESVLEKVKDVSERLQKYEEAQRALDKVLNTADETCSRAFGLAGDVGEGIQGAEKAIKKLEQVRDMLKGLKNATPAIQDAVTTALEGIHETSSNAKSSVEKNAADQQQPTSQLDRLVRPG